MLSGGVERDQWLEMGYWSFSLKELVLEYSLILQAVVEMNFQ